MTDQAKTAKGEHAFLYQNENWRWTVYVGVFPDAAEPMLTARIVAQDLDLFEDAVKFAKGKGFKSDKLIVQYLKQGDLAKQEDKHE